LMAELVGGRPKPEANGAHAVNEVWGEQSRWTDGEWWMGEEEEGKWSVKGETVLELGAGAWHGTAGHTKI
jgi:hypothetical protein